MSFLSFLDREKLLFKKNKNKTMVLHGDLAKETQKRNEKYKYPLNEKIFLIFIFLKQ